MTPVDRAALVERLARARAWNELLDARQADYRAAAARDIAEVEASKIQIERLGWILLDETGADAEVES